jgi:hypothetical protein
MNYIMKINKKNNIAYNIMNTNIDENTDNNSRN